MEYSCNGSCCARFFLAYTPEKIWDMYQEWLRTKVMKVEDIDMVGPMVIPIEPANEDGSAWWYTCRHWDTDTRLCKIYESRPKMCHGYPYSEPCKYCGWINEEFIEEQERKLLPPGPLRFD